MGPFELMDLIGLDVNLSVTESVFQATACDSRYAPHLIQQELVRSGRYGRKTGRGFYDHRKDAAPPTVATVEPVANAPGTLNYAPKPGLLRPLLERLQNAGVRIAPLEGLADEMLRFGHVHVGLTDGRTATERGAGIDGEPLLLLDLARDFSTTTTLGATANASGTPHLGELATLLHAAGIALIPLADVAGLAVMRTVCCLANEAADVMTWTGTKAADIDTAMRLGTAYPVGPLAWADAISPVRVATVLAHLQSHYGEARYRRAPALSKLRHGGSTFHG
jgi:3-hydroxybutyryl-CoA dehydrogenase